MPGVGGGPRPRCAPSCWLSGEGHHSQNAGEAPFLIESREVRISPARTRVNRGLPHSPYIHLGLGSVSMLAIPGCPGCVLDAAISSGGWIYLRPASRTKLGLRELVELTIGAGRFPGSGRRVERLPMSWFGNFLSDVPDRCCGRSRLAGGRRRTPPAVPRGRRRSVTCRGPGRAPSTASRASISAARRDSWTSSKG